jgi:L,D-transpeptidase catalytic domain
VDRASRGRGLLCLIWACGLLAAGSAPAAASDPIAVEAEPGERISDERSLSHWAFAEERGPILAAPEKGSPLVAKVRVATELGRPEVYLVLRRHTDKEDRVWLQVRIPMRPNGKVGWVEEGALGELRANRDQLVISRGKRRATLFRKGRRLWSAPIGIGRAGTPTPGGSFYVRERMSLGAGGGPYGTFAFGTSAYSPGLSGWPAGGVIGIHGTDEPGLIPGRISHGCVRVRNGDINKLRKLMDLGTPILIR